MGPGAIARSACVLVVLDRTAGERQSPGGVTPLEGSAEAIAAGLGDLAHHPRDAGPGTRLDALDHRGGRARGALVVYKGEVVALAWFDLGEPGRTYVRSYLESNEAFGRQRGLARGPRQGIAWGRARRGPTVVSGTSARA